MTGVLSSHVLKHRFHYKIKPIMSDHLHYQATFPLQKIGLTVLEYCLTS